MFEYLWQIIIGFSSGIAVGAGFVAFLTMLKVIPRLLQLINRQKDIYPFVFAVLSGSLLGTYFTFTDSAFSLPLILLIFFGLFHGVFNGMLAAALAEVLNVFPILSRRIGLENSLKTILMAIVFGKIFGSLFQWVVFVKL